MVRQGTVHVNQPPQTLESFSESQFQPAASDLWKTPQMKNEELSPEDIVSVVYERWFAVSVETHA